MTRTLAIVGAGRVGTALGKRLHRLGWRIGPVITRSDATARAAVRAIGAGRPCASLTRQVLEAALVLLATPDGVLPEVAGELARMGGEEWRGKIVLHTSGALGSPVLEPLAKLGAATGSLHPLQTFSGRSLPALEGIFFAVEGRPAALRAARQISRTLGGIPVQLAPASKPAYHAACAFAAGHALALAEAATRMLLSQGFTRKQAVRALLPLFRETLANFELLGPGAAWTGPLSRGDYRTVALHAAALRAFPAEYVRAYSALARLAARLLAQDPQETLRALEAIFGGAPAGSGREWGESP